jgi:hypothetical protein
MLLRLLGLGCAAAVVAMALGYYPTLRWAGREGVAAMLAGCAVALIAGLIGALPLCSSGWLGQGPSGMVNRILAASALRMAAALAMTLSLALSGFLPRAPLLVWIAVAYLWTLLVETVYLLYGLRVTAESNPD